MIKLISLTEKNMRGIMNTDYKSSNLKFNIFMTILFILLLFYITGCGSSADNSDVIKITILQTSDIHNHAAGHGPYLDYTPDDTTDNDKVLGGYSRLAAKIKSVRSEVADEKGTVLLFDSGDYFMGTMYDLTDSDPVTLKFFEMMDYDAITIGNHEFDWGVSGLVDMISAGVLAGFDVPIIASNLVTDSSDAADDGIETLYSSNVIAGKKIMSVSDDLKIGILGILGQDADNVAPLAPPITFKHDYAFLQSLVDDLRNNSGVDLVILLSHTGLDSDGLGEDTDIAENVSGIDIIASGHEHTATSSAFVKGASNTIIFSPGGYGNYLSRLDITYDTGDNKLTSHNFSLVAIDDTILGDTDIQTMVEDYDSVIKNALSSIGVEPSSQVSKIDFDLEIEALKETGLGNLIADAVRAAANNMAVGGEDPFQVSVVPSGVIRNNLHPGQTGIITFSDIYNVLPLGSSPYGDLLPGYPLMSFYITGPDLRNICEVITSVAPLLGSSYYLNISGVKFDYNSSNAFLSKVTDVYLMDTDDVSNIADGTRIDLTDTTTLYHIVVNGYAVAMMEYATDMGITIVPRDKEGMALTEDDYSAKRIDYLSEDGIQELKEWMALEYFLTTYYPASSEGISETVYGNGGTAIGRARDVTP